MRQTINPDILRHIQDDEMFQLSLSAAFPEIQEYILSYLRDSQCSCKNTILKHLWDSKDTYGMMSLENRYPHIKFFINIPEINPLSINKREMFGEVVFISSTKEAYRNLIKKAREEQWIFHGFTVTETKRKWKVFFY